MRNRPGCCVHGWDGTGGTARKGEFDAIKEFRGSWPPSSVCGRGRSDAGVAGFGRNVEFTKFRRDGGLINSRKVVSRRAEIGGNEG